MSPPEIESLDTIKRREAAVNVSFNQERIYVPIRFNSMTLSELDERMNKLEYEIDWLKNKLSKYEKLEINDSVAEIIIISTINKKKEAGIKEVNIFELSDELHLPHNQITRIMNKLKLRGVKERN